MALLTSLFLETSSWIQGLLGEDSFVAVVFWSAYSQLTVSHPKWGTEPLLDCRSAMKLVFHGVFQRHHEHNLERHGERWKYRLSDRGNDSHLLVSQNDAPMFCSIFCSTLSRIKTVGKAKPSNCMQLRIKWWTGLDSNQRTENRADLQSSPVGSLELPKLS